MSLQRHGGLSRKRSIYDSMRGGISMTEVVAFNKVQRHRFERYKSVLRYSNKLSNLHVGKARI